MFKTIHENIRYENDIWGNINLPVPVFCIKISMASSIKKDQSKFGSYLVTDINVLLMVEKGIRGGICHAIYRYVKAKNKYIEN